MKYTHGKVARKYLNSSEIESLIEILISNIDRYSIFCLFIICTGCRISEALNLRQQDIDKSNAEVVIFSLKKRGKIFHRHCPIPIFLLNLLAQIEPLHPDDLMWEFSRMTAYRKIKFFMAEAGITGSQAMPKGLRHAFGVRAVQSGISLNMVQKWLGHADIRTTSIYANLAGPEERALMERTWKVFPRTLSKLSADKSLKQRTSRNRC